MADDDLRRYAEHPDRQLRNRIVTEHLDLAVSIAGRYGGRGVPDDDLRQVAMLALLAAVDGFDPDRGVPFTAYASRVVDGRLKQWFRDGTWMVRVPRPARDRATEARRAVARLEQRLGRSPTVPELAAELDATEDEVVEALDASAVYRVEALDTPEGSIDPGGADAGLSGLADRLDLAEAVAQLPDAEAEVVAAVFVDGLTQREAAARLGISQMQVSRLQRRALSRLRARLAD
jgi:RNA polymerase sigma-B factor